MPTKAENRKNPGNPGTEPNVHNLKTNPSQQTWDSTPDRAHRL